MRLIFGNFSEECFGQPDLPSLFSVTERKYEREEASSKSYIEKFIMHVAWGERKVQVHMAMSLVHVGETLVI